MILDRNIAEGLQPPSFSHWCGTGLLGEDILTETLLASCVEVVAVVVVSAVVWGLGMLIGSALSIPSNRVVRDLLMALVHLFATLPVMLLALFLLILFGGGYVNSIAILVVATLPTQVLYAYNHLEEAKKEYFYLAKQSFGLSGKYIYRHHLLPYISGHYNQYTLSRLPEIAMMSLALGFLGLGAQAPNPCLGRMLFDGLSFMFSAWWLWLFPVIAVVFMFSVLTHYGRIFDDAH